MTFVSTFVPTKSVNYFTCNFSIGTCAVSAVCLILTVLIYILCLKGMSSAHRYNIGNPFKKACIIMTIQCSAYLVVSKVLEIIVVAYQHKRYLEVVKCCIQVISIFSSLLFYACACSTYFLFLYSMKNGKKAYTMLKKRYMYLATYLFPLLITCGIVIICLASRTDEAYYNSFTRQCRWKRLLLPTHLCVILFMTLVDIYAIVRSLNKPLMLNLATNTKLRRLIFNAKKLRTCFVLNILLIIVWILDIVLVVRLDVSNSFLCITILFHSLLGPYFLLFAVLEYSDIRLKARKKQHNNTNNIHRLETYSGIQSVHIESDVEECMM